MPDPVSIAHAIQAGAPGPIDPSQGFCDLHKVGETTAELVKNCCQAPASKGASGVSAYQYHACKIIVTVLYPLQRIIMWCLYIAGLTLFSMGFHRLKQHSHAGAQLKMSSTIGHLFAGFIFMSLPTVIHMFTNSILPSSNDLSSGMVLGYVHEVYSSTSILTLFMALMQWLCFPVARILIPATASKSTTSTVIGFELTLPPVSTMVTRASK